MHEIRNSDGRLVCRIDKATGVIEISVKGCVTLIGRDSDGHHYIVNIPKS